jgi:hypothetical protein
MAQRCKSYKDIPLDDPMQIGVESAQQTIAFAEVGRIKRGVRLTEKRAQLKFLGQFFYKYGKVLLPEKYYKTHGTIK